MIEYFPNKADGEPLGTGKVAFLLSPKVYHERRNDIMKNQHICPKCGSNDIFIIDGHAGAYGAGNNIENGLTVFSYIPVDRYVCGNCGFSEEWIRQEDIEKARHSKRAHR